MNMTDLMITMYGHFVEYSKPVARILLYIYLTIILFFAGFSCSQIFNSDVDLLIVFIIIIASGAAFIIAYIITFVLYYRFIMSNDTQESTNIV